MNYRELAFEIWRIWHSKRLSSKAATLFLVSGIAFLKPEWWFGLANTAITYLLDIQIEPFDESPIIGSALIALGLVLVAINIWENIQTRSKEVIGIRHNSLGNFPKEAIKPDLPLLQRLRDYREIDVDHCDAYNNGVLTDQKSILRRMLKTPIELDSLLRTNTNTPIAYYGLPHIPLAFYMGYLLADNKYQIQPYELNNEGRNWKQLKETSPSLEIVTNNSHLTPSIRQGDILLSIGISYPVHPSEINALNIPNIIGRVSIDAKKPARQLITSKSQIEQICKEFKTVLENIKNTCPNRKRIHIFYAGPVSLCFALGRCISERIDSEIVIYNYSVKEEPRYNWSLSINKPEPETTTFNVFKNQGDAHDSIQYA